MLTDLPGKSAVVTGAASGIGLAMARLFASEGMNVVLADVEEPALDKAVAEVAASAVHGAKAIAVVTDVALPESVEALADKAFAAFPGVDVLCNNAGVGSGAEGPMWQHERTDWQWAFAVNVWGVFHGIQAFLPRMIGQGHARPRRQHQLPGRRHRPAAHGQRLRRDEGRDRHDDRGPVRAAEAG